MAGVPPEYRKIFGYKWLGCGVAGCNYEITIQMVIVFVIKPIARVLRRKIIPDTNKRSLLKPNGPSTESAWSFWNIN